MQACRDTDISSEQKRKRVSHTCAKVQGKVARDSPTVSKNFLKERFWVCWPVMGILLCMISRGLLRSLHLRHLLSTQHYRAGSLALCNMSPDVRIFDQCQKVNKAEPKLHQDLVPRMAAQSEQSGTSGTGRPATRRRMGQQIRRADLGSVFFLAKFEIQT